jgi:hypothetical protein
MSRKLLICILSLSFFPLFVGTIHAVDSSSSATPTDPVTETLKERVQKVLSAQSSDSEGSLSAIGNFAFVGTLEKVVGSTVQIMTIANESKVCELDKTTKIYRQNKTIGKEEIELNSPVIIVGNKDSSGVLHVSSLKIVDDSIFPTKRQTIVGTISALSTKSLTLSLLGVNMGANVAYPTSTKTAFLDSLGAKLDKKTFVVGQKVLMVLPQTQTASASALRIFSLVSNPTGL